MWEYPTEEGSHDLFMDPGEEIRFRVTSEIFVDTSPNAPAIDPKHPKTVSTTSEVKTEPGVTSVDLAEELEEKKIPYLVHASVNESGLGLLSWWKE